MALTVELRLENACSEPYMLPVAAELGVAGFGLDEIGRRSLKIGVRFDDPDSEDQSEVTAARTHGAESRAGSLRTINPGETVRLRFAVDVPQMRLPHEVSGDTYALDVEVILQEIRLQDGTSVITQISDVVASENVVRQPISP